MAQDKEKVKRLAKKVIEHKGSTPLAHLSENIETNDKLDELIRTFKETPMAKMGGEIQKLKGDKGDTGEKGDKGEVGNTGKTGATGKQGPKGDTGATGAQGPRGFEGRTGRDGKDGKDGRNGKDGSPDMAEDIRNKLELLDGEERLDAKYIKNLPKTFTREIVHEHGGAHGGGYETPIKSGSGIGVSKDATGAWVITATGGTGPTLVDNEVVSGSGTTFTLANTPIANSQHIYVGGGRMIPGAGNDYIISGAVITLLNGSISAGQMLADYRY